MGNRPKIFQIFFDSATANYLDLGFEPFDNSAPIKSGEFEYGVMRQIYYGKTFSQGFTHLGVLSPKFCLKTGLSSAHVLSAIDQHDDIDVFMMSPCKLSSRFFNVWTQGDCSHPGLMELMQTIFRCAKIDDAVLGLRMGYEVECYSNYWVASRRFWDLYMSIAERIYRAIYSSESLQKKAFSPVFLMNGELGTVTHFPFIFERIFSTVLTLYGSSFRCFDLGADRGRRSFEL